MALKGSEKLIPEIDFKRDWDLVRGINRGGRGQARHLENKRFHYLVVVARKGSNKHGASMWLCKCDCGLETVIARPKLTSGKAKSCGKCLKPKREPRSGRFKKAPKASPLEDGDELYPDFECDLQGGQ